MTSLCSRSALENSSKSYLCKQEGEMRISEWISLAVVVKRAVELISRPPYRDLIRHFLNISDEMRLSLRPPPDESVNYPWTWIIPGRGSRPFFPKTVLRFFFCFLSIFLFAHLRCSRNSSPVHKNNVRNDGRKICVSVTHGRHKRTRNRKCEK